MTRLTGIIIIINIITLIINIIIGDFVFDKNYVRLTEN